MCIIKQQITESVKMFYQTTLAMYNSAVHQLILRVLQAHSEWLSIWLINLSNFFF